MYDNIITNLKNKLPNDEKLLLNLNQKINELNDKEKDSFINKLTLINFKDPTKGRILSIALGMFGVDRFYIGSYILGALKIILTIILIINVVYYLKGSIVEIKLIRFLPLLWYFADIFNIEKEIKKNNYEKILKILERK